MDPLPASIAPMLARTARPFDDDGFAFEVKWDGTRAIALSRGDTTHVHNRRLRPLADTYPELSALDALPDGLALDGEIVVFDGAAPSFEAMVSREQARDVRRARQLAAEKPAVYVAFDLLFEGGRSRMSEPYDDRRARLVDALAEVDVPRLVVPDVVVGAGVTTFEQAVAAGHEGVVAKRRDGLYHPGKRTDAWLKLKPVRRVACVVIGWLDDADAGLKSLVIASPDESGTLRPVGRVGTGWSENDRAALHDECRARELDAPLVRCDERDARWTAPGIFCVVRFVERTRAGNLRAPVLESWSTE